MLLACLAVVAALAACSADPTPTAAPTPTALPQPTVTPTTVPASGLTGTPMPAAIATPERIATLAPTATSASTSTPTSVPERDAATTPTPEATVSVGAGAQSASLVMLADPLDEPEFYCVDVAGFGANLNVNSPLQAHTCKPRADDELFAFNQPSDVQLYLVEHDRCIEADGSSLYVRTCSESPLQRFAHGSDGILRLDADDMYLTVAGGVGEPAGGPSRVRRDLFLRPCTEAEAELSRWVFPGPSPNA